jgi:hypothetical protein
MLQRWAPFFPPINWPSAHAKLWRFVGFFAENHAVGGNFWSLIGPHPQVFMCGFLKSLE